MKTKLTLLLIASALALVSCAGGSSSSAPSLDSSDPAGNIVTIDSTRDLIDTYGGTIVKASWLEGFVGDALRFNGYDSHVILPDHQDLRLTSEGTIGAFVYADSHRPFAGIVHKGIAPDFSDEDYTFQFWGTDGTLVISLVNAEGQRLMLYSQKKVDAGRWYHVAATWNADTVSLYIDGEPDASMPNTLGPARGGSGPVIIGAQLPVQYSQSWGNLTLDGMLDEVFIQGEAMSPEMVRSYYQNIIQSR